MPIYLDNSSEMRGNVCAYVYMQTIARLSYANAYVSSSLLVCLLCNYNYYYYYDNYYYCDRQHHYIAKIQENPWLGLC